jgi:hypothetical protein
MAQKIERIDTIRLIIAIMAGQFNPNELCFSFKMIPICFITPQLTFPFFL